MIKYFKYITAVFVIALFVSAIESTPAKAGLPQLPPNHEQLAEICLCFGKLFNGFNATGTQPNGQCARFQMGPFCFVDTELMPLFWKVQRNCEENIFVPSAFSIEGSPAPNFDCNCPPGKMVVSCSGSVSNAPGVDNNAFPGPPAINVWWNIWAKFDKTGCRLRVRNTGEPRNLIHHLETICASPGMPPIQ